MREKIVRLTCDFCGEEIDEKHTYSTGPNITNLSYTINLNDDYRETSREAQFDICPKCRFELVNLLQHNQKFSKLFSTNV